MQRVHPFLANKSPEDLQYTLPISLHEDAGPFSKRKSYTVYSFGSVLGVGSEQQCKFPIATEVKVPRACDVQFWRCLLADVDLCARDGFAHVDGIQWRACLIFGKADLEVCAVTWGAPHYGAGNEICA